MIIILIFCYFREKEWILVRSIFFKKKQFIFFVIVSNLILIFRFEKISQSQNQIIRIILNLYL